MKKRHPSWKRRTKILLICRWYDTINTYRKPREATKKLLELIEKFSKVSVYKINIQKSVALLYTNLSEREIKKTILLTIVSQRIYKLGVNLTKEVKDLYSENYKTLMKEIEDNTNKWKDTPCFWVGRINS